MSQSAPQRRDGDLSEPMVTDAADDERRRALVEYGLLDASSEQSFDDLTALAARLCRTPVALVTLPDGGRLHYKSRWGTPETSGTRHASFCQFLLDSPGVLVVPDALADPRFRDHPMVACPDGLRFYAGVSLTMADGLTVGALCVLDGRPRTLRRRQLDDLCMVARQVVAQLELRRQQARLRAEIAATALVQAELRTNRQLLDEVLGHADVAVYAKDLGGRYLMANTAMEAALGVGDGQLVGRQSSEVFPVAEAERFARNDAAAVESGTWQVYTEELTRPDGVVHTYRSTRFPLLDSSGQVHAIGGVSTDVTEVTAVRAELFESERRFRALFDSSPVAIGLSDEKGLWIQANAATGRLFGVEASELIGRSSVEFLVPDDADQLAQAERSQLVAPLGIGEAELRFRRPDGTIRWAWLKLTPIDGPHGEQWTVGIASDITDRKAMEDDLRRSEEELAAVAAVARCVQSGADPRPVVVESVRSLADATGVRLLEPVDATALRVTAATPDPWPLPADTDATDQAVRRTGQAVLHRTPAAPTGGTGPGDPPGGAVLWQPVVVEGEVIAVLHVVWDRWAPGTADWAVGAIEVLSGEAGASLHAVQLRAELERSAGTDPLTGALNRRAWDQRLDREVEAARSTGAPLTIALLDLDKFKSFNDSFGHAAGDELLRSFSTEVRALLDGVGVFARWGGEEFILALPGCDSQQAGILLERVSKAVPGRQTCSIGHVVWDVAEPIAACIGRADAALYSAKAQGRDRVVAG